MMSSLRWTRRFMCSVFLYTVFEYQEASGTMGTCVCTFYGKVHNLTSLQSRDEKTPRFKIDNSGYEYTYNPCRSFQQGECVEDVAICKSPQVGGSNQKIGDQSTAWCDITTGKPQLRYKTHDLDEKQWHVKVTLLCNRTLRSVQEARFQQVGDWSFDLSHICACPDECPNNSDDPATGTNGPSVTPHTNGSWKDIWEPVTIISVSVVFVAVVVIIVIWLWLKARHTENNPGERRNLIGRRDSASAIDESRNSFPDSNDGRKSANLPSVSPPMSMSSSSCSDITAPNKDVFNKTGGASVPV